MGRERCVGALLAGGLARRFGRRPKGLATIGGVRVAHLALGALCAATSDQLVVVNDPDVARQFSGWRTVPDVEPGLGPLAGLAAALEAADGMSIIAVAWDMPFVSAPLLAELRALGERGAAAVVPVHDAGQVEPLCAWYAPHALAHCRALLAAGERRATALTETMTGVVRVGDRALARFGDPSRLFASVDTPAQLAALGGSLA